MLRAFAGRARQPNFARRTREAGFKFFLKPQLLVSVELSFRAAALGKVFLRYSFDFAQPSCICTLPEDNDAMHGGRQFSSAARRFLRSENAPRTRWKQVAASFGSVGEMTAGP